MTIKRILALSFIFACTAVAWMILGGTLFARTYGLDEGLRPRVSSSWGTAQIQWPPNATYERETPIPHSGADDSRVKPETVTQTISLPFTSTRAQVRLELQHRQKGLLWYSTYKVNFAAEYTFENNSGGDQNVTFNFPLPAQQAMYDNVVFAINGVPLEFTNKNNAAEASTHIEAGKVATLKVGYS